MLPMSKEDIKESQDYLKETIQRELFNLSELLLRFGDSDNQISRDLFDSVVHDKDDYLYLQVQTLRAINRHESSVYGKDQVK